MPIKGLTVVPRAVDVTHALIVTTTSKLRHSAEAKITVASNGKEGSTPTDKMVTTIREDKSVSGVGRAVRACRG